MVGFLGLNKSCSLSPSTAFGSLERQIGDHKQAGESVAPTWDRGEGWLATMRHIAKEGGRWVIGVGTALQGRDVPKDFPGRDALFDDNDWLCDSHAVIVHPSGKVEAGPLTREREIRLGEIYSVAAADARRSLDVAGHYARPNVFRVEVTRRTLPPVAFDDS